MIEKHEKTQEYIENSDVKEKGTSIGTDKNTRPSPQKLVKNNKITHEYQFFEIKNVNKGNNNNVINNNNIKNNNINNSNNSNDTNNIPKINDINDNSLNNNSNNNKVDSNNIDNNDVNKIFNDINLLNPYLEKNAKEFFDK